MSKLTDLLRSRSELLGKVMYLEIKCRQLESENEEQLKSTAGADSKKLEIRITNLEATLRRLIELNAEQSSNEFSTIEEQMIWRTAKAVLEHKK
jgi:hypothetical protein